MTTSRNAELLSDTSDTSDSSLSDNNINDSVRSRGRSVSPRRLKKSHRRTSSSDSSSSSKKERGSSSSRNSGSSSTSPDQTAKRSPRTLISMAKIRRDQRRRSRCSSSSFSEDSLEEESMTHRKRQRNISPDYRESRRITSSRKPPVPVTTKDRIDYRLRSGR